MLVFVINKHGKSLMPCSPKKARLLLGEGKAKVVKRTPFTIQLLYGSSGYKQPVILGVDSGYNHIGLSAITEKPEVFSMEVKLRTDIVKLNSEEIQNLRIWKGKSVLAGSNLSNKPATNLDNQLLQETDPIKFLEYLEIRNICINNDLCKEQKD